MAYIISVLPLCVAMFLILCRYCGTSLAFLFILLSIHAGNRGGTVVKVLCYKSDGRWFDPRWCHWNFY